jgi:hypothetical protein
VKTSRGLLRTEAPREIIAPPVPIDSFGEVPGRKREARKQAALRGHALGPWHRRANDPAGRFNAFCINCSRLAVVATEAPDQLPFIYGSAISEACR